MNDKLVVIKSRSKLVSQPSRLWNDQWASSTNAKRLVVRSGSNANFLDHGLIK